MASVSAYAAVVSLRQVIRRIRQLLESGRIHWDSQQLQNLEDIFSFFQEFLQSHSSMTPEMEKVLSEIPSVAIEIHSIVDVEIVDQLKVYFAGLYASTHPLDLLSEKLELIKNAGDGEEMPATVENHNAMIEPWKRTVATEFDKDVEFIIGELLSQDPNLQIIHIPAYFGICIMRDKRIRRHFFFRIFWGDMSDDENSILSILASFVGVKTGEWELRELTDRLHKKLTGLRFLIILRHTSGPSKDENDNLARLKCFLPDSRNGSRVILLSDGPRGAYHAHKSYTLSSSYNLDETPVLFPGERAGQNIQVKVQRLQKFLGDDYDYLDADMKALIREICHTFIKYEDMMGNEGFSSVSEKLNILMVKIDCIKNDILSMVKVEQQGIKSILPTVDSFSSQTSSTEKTSDGKTILVGFDDHVNWLTDELTSNEKRLQVVPIVGMGGIGKTTLARRVYDEMKKIGRFDRQFWCTISQEYNVLQVLRSLLPEDKRERNQYQLGNEIHQLLHGRRYLIVMDDMWTTDVYEELLVYLPDNNKGSRIIVTTRMLDVANSLDSNKSYALSILDEGESWDLLKQRVFDGGDCPEELVEIGKKIAKRCGGLPLSLTVISGVLSKLERTPQNWERVAQNVKSVYSLEDGKRCLKILSLSYNFLPIHLKTCFLFFAFYPEDKHIYVKELLRCWIARGLLKADSHKILENVAEEYLMDLINRNLVMIHEINYVGRVIYCGIHDLLRELCLREIEKEKFLEIDVPRDEASTYVIHCNLCHPLRDSLIGNRFCQRCKPMCSDLKRPSVDQFLQLCIACMNMLFCKHACYNLKRSSVVDEFLEIRETCMNMLRCNVGISYIPPNPTTLQYFKLGMRGQFREALLNFVFRCPSGILYLWNLQYLIFNADAYQESFLFPQEIWELQQLRHLEIPQFSLPEPKTNPSAVLKDLQRLYVKRLSWAKDVSKRLPNLIKLMINLDYGNPEVLSRDWLEHIAGHAHLQSLHIRGCTFDGFESMDSSFLSLKKLTLSDARRVQPIFGSLQNLEILELYKTSFLRFGEWVVKEGEFPSLKVLKIVGLKLRIWRLNDGAFPRLETLILSWITFDFDFPMEIGDIQTLTSVSISECWPGTFESVLEVVKYAKSQGNEMLKVYCDRKTNEDISF